MPIQRTPRIQLDAAGDNQYGCAPYPDAELIAFGSSTASVVSGAGFRVTTYTRTDSG